MAHMRQSTLFYYNERIKAVNLVECQLNPGCHGPTQGTTLILSLSLSLSLSLTISLSHTLSLFPSHG